MKLEEAADALKWIDSDDRDTWYRMGMALKEEFGESAFVVWDDWSRLSDKYVQRTQEMSWRNFKLGKGITIASLVWEAKHNGWKGEITPEQAEEREKRIEERAAEAEKQRMELRYKAYNKARTAMWMIENSELKTHEYLIRKGFPDVIGFVYGEAQLLLVPVVTENRKILTVQMIDDVGGKRFLKDSFHHGGRATLGRGAEVWHTEGYSTGLSVKRALQYIGVDARILVCFTAANVAEVAKEGLIVTDNDPDKKGEMFAKRTGLPYWMPPTVGQDANDVHMEEGLIPLAEMLGEFRERNIDNLAIDPVRPIPDSSSAFDL